MHFKHEEVFEIEETSNPNFDQSYNMFNKKDMLICIDCGRIFDESTREKRIGLFKSRD